MAKFRIEGMKALQKSIKKLGDVPQKCVTPAAKKGMNIALQSAKANAPYESGELEGALKLIGEKSKYKGKKVYQVVVDNKKNDIFQKKNAKGEITGYYPASQEFGFMTRNGGYVPGFHFMKKALTDNCQPISNKIVGEMAKKIDKALEGK